MLAAKTSAERKRGDEMQKSKLIQKTVNKTYGLDDYYTEICDDKTQHWVHARDGFIFPETETTSISGFDVREINKIIKGVVRDEDFYRGM